MHGHWVSIFDQLVPLVQDPLVQRSAQQLSAEVFQQLCVLPALPQDGGRGEDRKRGFGLVKETLKASDL